MSQCPWYRPMHRASIFVVDNIIHTLICFDVLVNGSLIHIHSTFNSATFTGWFLLAGKQADYYCSTCRVHDFTPSLERERERERENGCDVTPDKGVREGRVHADVWSTATTQSGPSAGCVSPALCRQTIHNPRRTDSVLCALFPKLWRKMLITFFSVKTKQKINKN